MSRNITSDEIMKRLVALPIDSKSLNEVVDIIVRLSADLGSAEREARIYKKDLQKISEIENEAMGGDWDEIEKARSIARAALKPSRLEALCGMMIGNRPCDLSEEHEGPHQSFPVEPQEVSDGP